MSVQDVDVRARYRWERLSRKAAPYMFISPFYILFLIFGTFPILFSLYLSFHSWSGMEPMRWNGIANYVFTLTDPLFYKALGNTVVLMFMSAVPQHILALFFAFVLNAQFIRVRQAFRAAYFLPYVTSSVAVAIIFGVLFGLRYGFLNYALGLLDSLGPVQALFRLLRIVLPINWMGRNSLVKPAVSIMIIWRWTGWNTILYLAALQAIPKDLYDAARVDGANWPQVFFRITLPLLRPMMLFAGTMSVIGSMQIFDEPFVMLGPNGGTGQAGYTAVMYLYQTGFDWTFLGGACAIAYILLVIIFILSMINIRIFRRGLDWGATPE